MMSSQCVEVSIQDQGGAVGEGERLLLRGPEVAALLGISRALAYRWMKLGMLPTMRLAGCRTVRVPRAALLAFIRERTKQGAAA